MLHLAAAGFYSALQDVTRSHEYPLHKASLQNETVRFYSQHQNAAARSDKVHAVQGKSKHLCEIETKGEIFYGLSKAQVGPFYEKKTEVKKLMLMSL